MSFKDLARIEGYDLDAMQAELKAAKARIAELEAENQELRKLKIELADRLTRTWFG